VDLHRVHLNLPDGFELEDLLELRVELVELRARVLKQQLVEMLLAYVLVTLLYDLVFVLLHLLQNVHVVPAGLGNSRVTARPLV
jgi:hypothetical protein